MNIVKHNHRNPFMDQFFKDILGGTQVTQRQQPAVNISESEAAFTVELVAPGFKKEDFAVEIDNGRLTIGANLIAEKTEQEVKYTRKEFVTASFKRAFTLPESINEQDINAAYTDGILTLTLPKKEEALPKAKRSVAIL